MKRVVVNFVMTILLPLFFFSCLSDDSFNFSQNPYQSFDEPPTVPTQKNRKVIKQKSLDKATKLKGGVISEGNFELFETAKGSHLVYSSDDQKLFKVRSDSLIKVASEGKGPNQIYNGITLRQYQTDTYLIQRHRISKIAHDNGPKLEVLQNISQYINYFAPIGKDKIVANKYSYKNRSSFQLVDKNFNELKQIGGCISSKDPDLNKMLNFTIVASNNNGKLFAQAFIFTPYVGLYNQDLQLQKVIHLDKSIPISLDQTEFEQGNANIIRTKKHSVLAGLQPYQSDKLWLSIKTRKYPRKQKQAYEPMTPEVEYKYYVITADMKIYHAGESTHYVIPHNGRLYFSQDGYFWRTSIRQ